MRTVSYKRLWKLLIDRDMTKAELRERAGISASSMSKLSNGGNVTVATLIKVYDALGCEVHEILELEHVETPTAA